MISLRRPWAAVPLAFLIAGCDVPMAPIGASVPPPPTLRGQVQGQSASHLRVALLGAAQAGQTMRELVSAPVTGSTYTLRLPASPPLDLMLANETQSIAFSLQAYNDANANGQYDPGEETNAVADTSAFRYFSSDGPAGSYRAGWNALNKNGQYTQSFDTAFNLTTDTSVASNAQ